MKKFVESKDCARIYAFLKNQKGKEIAPRSNLTFRTFEQSLKDKPDALHYFDLLFDNDGPRGMDGLFPNPHQGLRGTSRRAHPPPNHLPAQPHQTATLPHSYQTHLLLRPAPFRVPLTHH